MRSFNYYQFNGKGFTKIGKFEARNLVHARSLASTLAKGREVSGYVVRPASCPDVIYR